MGPEILAPFTVFGSIVLIVYIVFHFGAKNRREVLETVRAAAQSGTQLTPDVIKALGMPRRAEGRDIRWGIVLLAIAGAIITFGSIISGIEGEAEGVGVAIGIASFPGFVGIALIAMGVLFREKKSNVE